MSRLTCSLCFLFIAILQRAVLSTRNFDLQNVCKNIWNGDTNRVKIGQQYMVDVQGRFNNTKEKTDNAESPLFTYFDDKMLSKPTFKAFLSLLDNYNRFVGRTENMSEVERNETWTFIEEISKTSPVMVVHKYLANKGLAPRTMDGFKKRLFDVWFHGYRRKRYQDSSGFEHVFVGEIWRGKVTGLHNWLQLYHLEKEQLVDYRGYYKFDNIEPIRLKIKFHWQRYKKKQSSIFLGTSPEFEVALYTLCFHVRPGRGCRCRMNNGQKISISTRKDRRSGFIRTAYSNT